MKPTSRLSKRLQTDNILHYFLVSAVVFSSFVLFLFPVTANAQTGTFSATGSMTTARYGHTATLLPNGRVLIAGGGSTSAPVGLASAELYDPTTGHFTATGSMTVGRFFHTATLLQNGKVLLTGGVRNGDSLASAELYDPSTGTFTATGSMSYTRYVHTATLLANGQVLIAAGNFLAGIYYYLASAELYNPTTGIFSPTGSMSVPRYAPYATLLPNGKVLVAGGYNGNYLAIADLYDPSTGTFSSTSSMITPRAGGEPLTGTTLLNGKVLFAAGVGSGGSPLASAELYDPNTGTFSATGSMTYARGNETETMLPNGEVLVAGGTFSVKVAEVYDPTARTFSVTGPMVTPRTSHTATLLSNGQVLIAGGGDGVGYIASAELYSTSTGPLGYSLTVSVAGNGLVTSNPSGISCTTGTCIAFFPPGTNVTLTETPGSGAKFTGWAHSCSGTSASCALTVNSAQSVSASFATSISIHNPIPAVSVGNSHVLALASDGTLRSWGSNAYGQLGIGTPIVDALPTQVNGLSGFVKVSAGYNFTVALKSDGSVWSWGVNSHGELGDGTTSDRSNPMQVTGISGVVQIAAGESSTVALKSDGTVWAWGYNGSGGLGNNTTNSSSVPIQVTGLGNVVKIAAGSTFAFALKNDGTVWAWGANGNGQLGIKITTDQYSPVQVTALTNVVSVGAGGYHALAVKSDGSVWSWGENGYSELGDGTTTSTSSPVRVIGLANVIAVAGGEYHSVALKADGTVWTWGWNYFGQLGDGTTVQRTAPVPVPSLTNVASIAVSSVGSYVVALKNDGSVWAWGANGSGQLGDGTTIDQYSPVLTVRLPSAIAIGGGADHSAAVAQDGSVWAWGDNSSGELGFGSTDNRSTPQHITTLANVVAISAASESNLALKNDGSAWSWGINSTGQLGDGTLTPKSAPVQITGISGVAGVCAGEYHSAAVKVDGTAWAWGSNGYGELGNNSYVNSYIPVQVTGLTNAIAVAVGTNHTIALESDGSVWAWGYNADGELGDGTTTTRSAAVQVAGLSNVIAISAGAYHNLALKSDGTVWAWGYNYYGELGDGTSTNRLLPVQVTGISNAIAVAAGGFHSIVLKSDGTVWVWGANDFGELGDGTAISRLTAVQVPGLTGVTNISAGKEGVALSWFSMAVKQDGTVYAWGLNEVGQLGDGTYAQRLTPVVVLNVNGSGSLLTGDWFLDLVPGTSAIIPTSYVPSFELVAAASGSDTSKTVSATIKINAADARNSNSIFVTAIVPKGALAVLQNGPSTTIEHRIQVGRNLSKFEAARTKSSAADLSTFVLIQNTPSGWVQVVNGQLIPYVNNVTGESASAMNFIKKADVTSLQGAQFCISYGSASGSDLNSRTVVTISDPNGTGTTQVTCFPTTAIVSPKSGYWWNPAEGGRGYTIEQNSASGNIFFATYLYTASGSPIWYAAGPAPMNGSTFNAPLTAYSGGQTLTGTWHSATTGASPGNVSIVFTDATDGTLSWPGGTIPIKRYEFVGGGLNAPPTGNQPQSGYWWNPAEGGRGYTVEVQNGMAFIAAYMYDANGNPVWYASGPAALTQNDTYQGSWVTYGGGETLTGSYRPAAVTGTAGSLTIQFTSATAGTLTLPNGTSIPIQRYAF